MGTTTWCKTALPPNHSRCQLFLIPDLRYARFIAPAKANQQDLT